MKRPIRCLKKYWILVALVIISITLLSNLGNIQSSVVGNESSPTFGLIVPHHSIASELIDEAFSSIKDENEYDLIIIIGPNHHYPESNTYSTASQNSKYFDGDFVGRLSQKFPDIVENDELINNEHSIMAIKPYTDKYFPKASVVPFVLSTNYDEDDLRIKAKYLSENARNALFVVSVDFSHNSHLSMAIDKDSETLQTIEKFEYLQLLNYQDDHLDSPVSMSEFLMIMQEIGATKLYKINESHSTLINDSYDLQGTSYVTAKFTKE